MKASTTAKITTLALAFALAAPLGAMARNRTGDILAGALIGVVAGSILASAADGGCVYVAPPPPPRRPGGGTRSRSPPTPSTPPSAC